jgi:elongation factor G
MGHPKGARSNGATTTSKVASGTAADGCTARSARCIALVGPYLSGKTTLLDALLARTGAIQRQGSVADKATVGDDSPEARAHAMSVDMTVATLATLLPSWICRDQSNFSARV